MVDASVSFAVQRLGDFLIQETVFLHGVKDEVESLKNELRWMRSFLKDAEQKQDGNEGIRNWVTEIQDIAYDTEDVIETFFFKFKGLIQTSRREMLSNSVRNCFGICTIPDRYGIGREIKALKNRVLEVKRMRETYGINNIGGGVQEGTSNSACNLRDLRITTSYAADEEDVVGFEDDAQFLQGKLFQNQPGRSVISILGMGGLGKTTLARKLYNNNNTKFDLHAWVYVSQEWQPRDLLERLVKSFKKLTKDELKMLEKMRDYEMEEYLRDLLEGHKYLVVIDDVWEIDAWQSLRKALPDNQNGSRIIITTRKEAIAELSDQRTHVHKLRFLRENESWPLFCKKAFPGSGACPQDMKKLGKQMMAKCGGLPLAIIVLGGLLSRKQFHEWHVVKELIWRELKNDSSDISLLLALSYNDLSHELKSCFLYLGLFPEDSIIDVEKLTRMWVAEQFITQEGGGGGLDDLEEVAENYLKELIRRSLIQVVGRNWRMVTRCRVHDLLRDLAVNKANELNFLHIYNEALNSAPLNVACQRISFHSEFESRVSFDHLRQRVRTISYNGFYSEKEMVINLVSKFGLLKVLDIKEVRFDGNAILRFGKVVVKLIHLRYLGLHNTGNLPKSIGNCQALRTLDFDSVNNPIVMLPTSIKKLKQLRHLSGWFDGSPLLFEELTNLQCLNRLDISRWLKQQKGNEFALNAFGKLLNLKVLSLYLGDHSSPLVSVEPLLNCRHLIELTIEGGIKKVPEEMHTFLPNLKFLDLRESRLEQDPMPALEMLPNLLVLLLNRVLDGEIGIMICTATGFPQLVFLWLINDSMKLQVEEGGMPRLRALGIGDEILKSSLPERFRSLPGRASLNWDWGIKRDLCLALVRRVPLFNNMDERLLDAICERLKPRLYTENTYLVREGDPVDEMLFIIRGHLESGTTTDGGRSGLFPRFYLQEGDFCGEQLLTWALDPKSGSNLPSSTRTVKALTEVEAFALIAEEMKFFAGQFRQHTVRYYSQQWRTWAACIIQAAWWRYSKRKIMELRRKEEEEAEGLGAARNNAGVVPTRKVVYFKTRTKRGGRPVNDHVAAIMAKMTQLAAPPEEDGSQPLTDDEIWAKTFPPDKSGRVMCMGSNVTPSQMFGRRRASEQQHREEVNSLRSQLASTQSRLESTEKELVQTKSTMEVYEQNQAKQREELNGLRGQLDLVLGALQGRGLNLDCGMRAPSSGGSSCA